MSQFKDGSKFPSQDKNVTVIGGVDSSGDVQALTLGTDGAISVSAAASSAEHVDDAAFAVGDTGVLQMGVIRTAAPVTSNVNGDYAPVALNRYGVPLVVVEAQMQGTNSNSLLKIEDAAAGSGDAGVNIMAVRKDTMASSAGTDGDYAHVHQDAGGRLYVNDNGCSPDQMWYVKSSTVGNTTLTSIKAAGGANVRHYVTDIIINNTSATGTRVDITDGTSFIQAYVGGTSTQIINLKTPFRGAANAAISFQCETTSSSTTVTLGGYSLTSI